MTLAVVTTEQRLQGHQGTKEERSYRARSMQDYQRDANSKETRSSDTLGMRTVKLSKAEDRDILDPRLSLRAKDWHLRLIQEPSAVPC